MYISTKLSSFLFRLCSGLPKSQLFGFHVHQYGDLRVVGDTTTTGKHFMVNCANLEPIAGCQDDQTHGYPPSLVRHYGDMGNLTSDALGNAVFSQLIGQNKMSLTDPLKSILGRTALIHVKNDNGQNIDFGSAGVMLAGGPIGLVFPGDAGTNNALAPQTPSIAKVVVNVLGTVSGALLLSKGSVTLAGVATSWMIQGVLVNLPPGSYKLQFNKFGDFDSKKTGATMPYFVGLQPVTSCLLLCPFCLFLFFCFSFFFFSWLLFFSSCLLLSV